MSVDEKAIGHLISVKDTTGQFTPAPFIAHVVELLTDPCVVIDTATGRQIVKAADCTSLGIIDQEIENALRLATWSAPHSPEVVSAVLPAWQPPAEPNY